MVASLLDTFSLNAIPDVCLPSPSSRGSERETPLEANLIIAPVADEEVAATCG